MDHDDEKVDLSDLAPDVSSARWEQRVRLLRKEGRARLRRARVHRVLEQLAAWARPVLLGASVAAAASVGLLTAVAPPPVRAPRPQVARAPSAPTPQLLQWAMVDRTPSSTELYDAFLQERR